MTHDSYLEDFFHKNLHILKAYIYIYHIRPVSIDIYTSISRCIPTLSILCAGLRGL